MLIKMKVNEKSGGERDRAPCEGEGGEGDGERESGWILIGSGVMYLPLFGFELERARERENASQSAMVFLVFRGSLSIAVVSRAVAITHSRRNVRRKDTIWYFPQASPPTCVARARFRGTRTCSDCRNFAARSRPLKRRVKTPSAEPGVFANPCTFLRDTTTRAKVEARVRVSASRCAYDHWRSRLNCRPRTVLSFFVLGSARIL